MSRINNKNILITGATSGIGKALTLQLARDYNHLFLVGRNAKMLNELKSYCDQKNIKVSVFECDLSAANAIDELAKQIALNASQIDIIINNAGISQRSRADETNEKVDRSIMELNFFAPVKLTKLLWPMLIKSKHANVVNISSVVGTFGFPQRSAYAASKHALEGFFESWMLENVAPNIHFTTVSPGRINTAISYNALKKDGSKHEITDDGQANGIEPDVCARRIIDAIEKNKRKIYIVKQERVLLFVYRFFPSIFVLLVKKLKLS